MLDQIGYGHRRHTAFSLATFTMAIILHVGLTGLNTVTELLFLQIT